MGLSLPADQSYGKADSFFFAHECAAFLLLCKKKKSFSTKLQELHPSEPCRWQTRSEFRLLKSEDGKNDFRSNMNVNISDPGLFSVVSTGCPVSTQLQTVRSGNITEGFFCLPEAPPTSPPPLLRPISSETNTNLPSGTMRSQSMQTLLKNYLVCLLCLVPSVNWLQKKKKKNQNPTNRLTHLKKHFSDCGF